MNFIMLLTVRVSRLHALRRRPPPKRGKGLSGRFTEGLLLRRSHIKLEHFFKSLGPDYEAVWQLGDELADDSKEAAAPGSRFRPAGRDVQARLSLLPQPSA